jgi:membrane-associated phospholipid phosphatase
MRFRWLTLVGCLAGVLPARPALAADPDRVEWSPDWPRMRPWEIANAAVLTVADTVVETRTPIAGPYWHGGILFDDWARGVFRGRTLSTQSTASTISDVLYQGGTLAPFIVDILFVALDVHESADVALQMLLINMQSLSLAGLMSLTAEHAAGRARPYTENCVDGTVKDQAGVQLLKCGTSNDNRSFFSGHVTSVATMAGLTCVHHQHIPLYGGGVADLAPCLVMWGMAGATGVLRLVYDEHWATDVVVGWAVGAAAGYVLPSIMHYGWGDGRAAGEIRAGGITMVPTAQPYPGGMGLGFAGVF